MFFYIVIGFLVISWSSSIQTETIKIILRRPNNNISGNDTRIIGGHAITIEDAPWQVAILEKGDVVCGGSVLSNRHILTAAHCVYGYKTNVFSVRAGSTYYNKGGQLRAVAKLLYDGKYNPNTNNNDIAMMKLRRSLQLNEFVTPVNLPTTNLPDSRSAAVSGWGLTRESGRNVPQTLREVTVKFVTMKSCRNAYKPKNIPITTNMLCAGAVNGGKDACQGDSGGPLVENGTLYGIVSMGIGCGRPRFPGIYTSVFMKLKWIQKAMSVI